MMAKVTDSNVSFDVSRCILMYMNGTHQDTIRIHARYIKIHQDTYPIGNPPQKWDRKPHVTPGASPELPEIISVISSPISPSRLSARSDLRYLFVLATVHYGVLSDGRYRLDVSKAVAGVGWRV